jgi:hypothetical protein
VQQIPSFEMDIARSSAERSRSPVLVNTTVWALRSTQYGTGQYGYAKVHFSPGVHGTDGRSESTERRPFGSPNTIQEERMGDDSVEQFWYILWLIKAIIALGFFGAVTLICTSAFGLLRSKRTKRRSFEQPIVRLLGTPPPLRSFDASQFKAIDRSPVEKKKRIG